MMHVWFKENLFEEKNEFLVVFVGVAILMNL